MAVMHYQTRDGLADYGFSIEFQPDRGWGVYIVFQPFFYGHDGGLKFPYQSIDRNGRRYVNWPAEIDSLGDAKTVAALWAELIQRYWHAEEKRRADSDASEGSDSRKQLRKDVA
ncbi:MAG: hypothetical protein DLM62_14825 [Pseudonocardiales bacterium]|nr:MAG: hypothetical protein DLM62_14825 [Pseudonocardiales bacterium]